MSYVAVVWLSSRELALQACGPGFHTPINAYTYLCAYTYIYRHMTDIYAYT